MKRRIIAFAMLMTMLLSMTGCAQQELDICDPVLRDYLNAETEADQVSLLQSCSGVRLSYQNLSFTWETADTTGYTVYFSENKDYTDARVYKTPVATVKPDGVFVPGRTYYWKVENSADGSLIHQDAFTVTDSPVRFITTSQVTNMRDVGGWKTSDGKTVRYERIYRGGITNPGGDNNFPVKDVALFRDVLGIQTEIDLRTPQHDDRNQTVSILGETAPYHKLPIDGYCYIIPGFRQSAPISRAYSRQTTESIREIFHILSNEDNYPVYIHCNAGADRTGTIVYLINGVLGVPYEDLTRDFEITSFSQAGRRWRSNIVEGQGFDESGVMQDDQENYVAWGKMHQMMTEEYGGDTLQETIENYLINACGVPKEEIESLRNIMLEK